MPEKRHASSEEGKRWQKTPTPNLIRYVPKGTYYMRARVRGLEQPVRESLKTTRYRVAQVRLAVRLRELRMTLRAGRNDELPETLAAALVMVRAQIANDPSLKTGTRRAYFESLDRLKPGAPAALPATPIDRLDEAEMAVWWSKTAAAYAPQQANHLLMFLRRALRLARKCGALLGDPTEQLRRIKIPRTKRTLPTVQQFRLIVDSIRSQRKAHSEQAANWVEFMTYSGPRPAELAAIEWPHIDEGRGVLWVFGDPANDGTKNREARPIPMNEALCGLVKRMRGDELRVGRVFTLKKPHDALSNACQRLGLPHLRIYDLRHMFATVCIEQGVDVPMVAGWLGHKDGGALAMRTYVHPGDEHSRRMAAKVKFA